MLVVKPDELRKVTVEDEAWQQAANAGREDEVTETFTTFTGVPDIVQARSGSSGSGVAISARSAITYPLGHF
jgi:hypothetical protein